MMTGMTLVEFLTARLTEEHEVAEREHAYPNGAPRDWREKADQADSLLVGMFSPGRVLAEVAAKRRILAEHRDDHQSCSMCGTAGEYDVPWPCTTVELLALPYAGHPDYREEWKP